MRNIRQSSIYHRVQEYRYRNPDIPDYGRKRLWCNCVKISRCAPYGMMSYRNGSSPLLMYVEY